MATSLKSQVQSEGRSSLELSLQPTGSSTKDSPLLGNWLLLGILGGLVRFLSTCHKSQASGKRDPQLKSFIHRICHGQIYRTVWWLMIDDWCEWSRHIVEDAIPVQKVLGSNPSEQAEQAMGKRLISNVPPCLLLQFLTLGSCFEFLLWLPFRVEQTLSYPT